MTKKTDFSEYLIEHRSETRQLQNELVKFGYSGVGLENISWARHDRFLREFAPRITDEIDARQYSAIEIGCGAGSVTHAFAHVFKSITAYEIDNSLVDLVNMRASLFGLENMRCFFAPPESIVTSAVSDAKSPTIFILFAVLEHMTESERINTISVIWDKMTEDDYLYVGNTPNRLSYQDLHTHEHPFILGLPDFTALSYLKMHPEITLAKYLTDIEERESFESFSIARKRKGLGVSYHDFEIALGGIDLNDCVVISDIGNPWQFHDALLTSFFINENIDVPMCFAMRDMNFLVKKPSTNDKEKNRLRNNGTREKFTRISKDVLRNFVDSKK